MSRRRLTILVLALTSVILAACSQTTAPRRADTGCTIVTSGTSGYHC